MTINCLELRAASWRRQSYRRFTPESHWLAPSAKPTQKEMHHLLYCSSGNRLGIPEYLGYSEIGDDGYWVRYVEVRVDGTALRYSTGHSADAYGVLPEGQWDQKEASKAEYGAVTTISAKLFEAVWSTTRCINVG